MDSTGDAESTPDEAHFFHVESAERDVTSKFLRDRERILMTAR